MTRFIKLSHASALLLGAAGCIALTPSAFAASSDDPVPQTRLSVAGTDFTSQSSVAHLKIRLRHAAIAVCAPDWDGRQLLAVDERRCYDKAVDNGLAQVESKQQDAMRKATVNMADAQPQERPIR